MSNHGAVQAAYRKGLKDGRKANRSMTDLVGCAMSSTYYNPPDSSDPDVLEAYRKGYEKGQYG